MDPEGGKTKPGRRNRTAWVLVGLISVGLVGGVGTIKLNERVSDAALKAKLEATIRGDVDLMKSDLSELRVRNFKVTRQGNTATFEGEMVVPRRRFEYTNNHWLERVSFAFEPSGEAVFPVSGEAGVTRQHLSSLRFLGAVRPVWSSLRWQISGPNAKVEDAEREELMKREGANALFDTQFDDFRNSYDGFYSAFFYADSDVLAVLVRERRYAEAAKTYMALTGRTIGIQVTRREYLRRHLAEIRRELAKEDSVEARKVLGELDAHEVRRARGDFEPPNDVL